MHRIQAINTKDTREAKGTQMLKVNGTTKSVNRHCRAGHISGNINSPGIGREQAYCSDGVKGTSDHFVDAWNTRIEHLKAVGSQV